MATALSTREFNRRIKTSLAALRETGTRRIAIEISPDGSTRVYELSEDDSEDEANRLGRMIEGRMGG